MPLTNPGIDWDSRVDSKPQTSALRPKEREREGERERVRVLDPELQTVKPYSGA